MRKKNLYLYLVVNLILALFGSGLSAEQEPGRDIAHEQKYYDSLEQIAPAAVGHFKAATFAMDSGDPNTAVVEYGKVLELAQDYVPAIRRLSYVVVDKQKALALAERALELEDHAYNKIAVGKSLLRFESKQYDEKAYRMFHAASIDLPDDIDAYIYLCEIAAKMENWTGLKRAARKVRDLEPDHFLGYYYLGIAAAYKQDAVSARDYILKAKELGLDEQEANRLLYSCGINEVANQQAKTAKSGERNEKYGKYALYGLAGWGGGLIFLFATGMILSGMTLMAIKKQDVRYIDGELQRASGGVLLIRKLYKLVLALASIYYYISIPIIIMLVLAAGAGVFYGFFAIGRIPIKLAVIVAVVVLVSIFSILKSIFTIAKDQDPGHELTESDAPTLFKVLRDVAGKVGTSPVDRVFVVEDATVAVYEQGSFLKRITGQTKRCLILGLGALNGMTQTQLKAILAHEYGHFNNKDTAGGSMALHVRRSIHSSAENMARGGAAAWYNPAWLFMNAYYRIYLKVSHGASRLQEVLADQIAAINYGASAFASGLKHIIRRSIEFDMIVNSEIDNFVKNDSKVTNFYSMVLPDSWVTTHGDGPVDNETDGKTPLQLVEERYKDAYSRPTSSYDSHPAATLRIELVNKIEGACGEADSNKSAWELIDNPKQLQEKMTCSIYSNVTAYLEAVRQQQAS